MKKPRLLTVILIIVIAIVGLYTLGEVDYYSMKAVHEKDSEYPVLTISTIGLRENVNNKSLSQGVYIPPDSYSPATGDISIYGHRTLQGSPFLRLNQVNPGDKLVLKWPEIGEITYNVTNKKVVPKTYSLTNQKDGNKISLITCSPIGSTANRLIIEGYKKEIQPIQEKTLDENSKKDYGSMIAILFLIGGLGLSLAYDKDNRVYLIGTVLLLSSAMFYFHFFPIESEMIFSKIKLINGYF